MWRKIKLNTLSSQKHFSVYGCHIPLISICDRTTQIKLNLSSCSACDGEAAALVLSKAGCDEYETVCAPPPNTCCGVIDNRYKFSMPRSVLKPKPTVIYPLHEVDTEGYSVFVLDNNLKKLGYGRYNAKVVVMSKQGTSLPALSDDLYYTDTGVKFDIDYNPADFNLQSIKIKTNDYDTGDC